MAYPYQPYPLCVCCSLDIIFAVFFLQTIVMFDICTRFDGISCSHSIAYWPVFTLGGGGDGGGIITSQQGSLSLWGHFKMLELTIFIYLFFLSPDIFVLTKPDISDKQ